MTCFRAEARVSGGVDTSDYDTDDIPVSSIDFDFEEREDRAEVSQVSSTLFQMYLIFRDITRNVVGNTRYYAKFFMQHLVFLCISCYIPEILITFWTVYMFVHIPVKTINIVTQIGLIKIKNGGVGTLQMFCKTTFHDKGSFVRGHFVYEPLIF